MKKIFIILFVVLSLNTVAQEPATVVEEKSSGWLKVGASAPAKKTNASTVKKRTVKPKPAAPKQDQQETFHKTNSKVNRFRKKD